MRPRRPGGDDEREPHHPHPGARRRLQTDDAAALRSEAANRRRALRAEEAKSAALQARVDAGDVREVDRLRADRLQVPADAWLDPEFTLDAMRTQDGEIDLDLAGQAVAELEDRHPHWKKLEPAAPHPAYPEVHQGARTTPVEPPSFGRALKTQR